MSINLDIPAPLFAFLKDEIVLTLATTVDNQPYCCNCFYALIEDEMSMVFKSSSDARHSIELIKNGKVAGTIYQNYGGGHTKGIQYQGVAIHLNEKEELSNAKDTYYKKYPFARVVKGEFYKVHLNSIKMTEKKMAIGHEYFWKRNVKFKV